MKIRIDNMSCSHCIESIKTIFENIAKVVVIKSVKLGKAVLIVSDDLSKKELIKEIEDNSTYKVLSIK